MLILTLFNYITNCFILLYKASCNVYLKRYIISSTKLTYQNSAVFTEFNCSLNLKCIIEFVYAYQINTSLVRNGISSQNNIHIFKLLKFDMQH